jgi:hypothetical protein
MAQIMNETLDLETEAKSPTVKRDKAEKTASLPESLISELERLVAMSSNQNAKPTDVDFMLRSIQATVSKALQGPGASTREISSNGVEDEASEATAVNSTTHDSMDHSQLTTLTGIRQPNAKVVERQDSIKVSAQSSILSHQDKSSEWVDQKLLSLWSEALDLSEDSIEPSDSFFVSTVFPVLTNVC